MLIDPDGRSYGDFHDRKGGFLGTDGKKDGKIYLLNKGVRAVTEDKRINWGGTLKSKHSEQLKKYSKEVGGLIIQNRKKEGKDYTISEFKTVGGEKNIKGYMLEPSGPSTSESGKDKRIPEGVYDIDNYSSEKYPNNYILSNDQVSKERKILYHSGNDGGDTSGCNLPGETENGGTVGGSRKKMNELRNFIESKGAKNVKTIIND